MFADERNACKDSLRRNILNGMKEILRVVLHEQCFYYRLERIFETAEADEPKIVVLRRKHTDGLLNMRLCTGKMAMRLCLPARFIDESEALSFPLPLLMRLS